MIAARHAQFVWVGVLWAYRAQVWSVSKGVKRGGGLLARHCTVQRQGEARPGTLGWSASLHCVHGGKAFMYRALVQDSPWPPDVWWPPQDFEASAAGARATVVRGRRGGDVGVND